MDRPDCDLCLRYVRELESRSAAMSEWDGEVLLVLPASDSRGSVADLLATDLVVVEDRDGRLIAGLGVDPPAVVIADRWGVVRSVHAGGADHDLMTPDEVVAWLRFMAIECPECEGEAF